MVKLHIQKCCFCISLRRGCIGIALFDIIINLLIIFLMPDDQIIQSERAVAICHCIGCVMLFLGAIVESAVLLLFYLITSFVNTIIVITCFVIVSIHTMSVRVYFLIPALFLIVTACYFYVVAYSYYQHVNSPYEDADDEA